VAREQAVVAPPWRLRPAGQLDEGESDGREPRVERLPLLLGEQWVEHGVPPQHAVASTGASDAGSSSATAVVVIGAVVVGALLLRGLLVAYRRSVRDRAGSDR
jgi:hypothetical protein